MKKKYAVQQVWLITGCSRGLGMELARTALEAGNYVVVTARDLRYINSLSILYPDTSLALKMDVTQASEIKNVVHIINERLGRIDVLINNAGTRYYGAIEESEEYQIKRLFNVNFFGLTKVTNEVLPLMRAAKSGYIVNISSIGGLVGYAGMGYYSATKFAVEGYSEALSVELEPIGIRVMSVALSGYRTNWEKCNINITNNIISDYNVTSGANINKIVKEAGNQAGCPKRAAKAILLAIRSSNPPSHLILGKFAIDEVRRKISLLNEDVNEWENISKETDIY